MWWTVIFSVESFGERLRELVFNELTDPGIVRTLNASNVTDPVKIS